MNNRYLKNILLVLALASLFSCRNTPRVIDLSGKWEVVLDSLNAGTIRLPGTLCEGGYGTPCTEQPRMEKEAFSHLKAKYDYVGVARYNKEVDIPSAWKDKAIVLTLERVLWESQVWVNGEKIDRNESLSAPHRYDLTDRLKTGKNKISIRIDNTAQYDVSWNDFAHAYTNETQTQWNGIIGKIELEALDKIHIRHISLFPDVDNSLVKVQIDISKFSGENPDGELTFYLKNGKGHPLAEKKITYTGQTPVFDYPIENPLLWDEFAPNLYEAVAELRCGESKSVKTASFGMRKLTNRDALLQINDRRMFLRGTLECCIFPLKGYPAMEVREWEKIFLSAKNYGLNHIRFHSWCPPEAAFKAADQTGIYLQIELPYWQFNAGENESTIRFLYAEGERIIKEYGNHPSFCFWSMGNELSGDFTVLDKMMRSLKSRDSRRLYTTTSFTFQYGSGNWPEKNDDYWITQWTKKGWVRGQGIFNDKPARFDADYSGAIDSLPVPVVSHEIGQYSVYPNLKETDKYTGNLLPVNFRSVRRDLEEKGMINLADDYLNATGKLAVLLYKEEIERALKTPGFSGFQLLDLHDFPGQSTALVGVLDAFWDSKGFVSGEEFRRFCSPAVPLVRFEKATYTDQDTLTVKAEIANFSSGSLENLVPVWELKDTQGKILAGGKLPKQNIPTGNAFAPGEFSVPLSFVKKAEKLTLSLALENTEYINSWDIWVYPESLNTDYGEIVCTQSFEEAERALKNGATVLLNPAGEDLIGLEGKFVPVFWSPVHFPNQAGTMGILCDPQHPVFRDFPTEFHGNWQWWDICKHAKTVELDSLNIRTPLIRMIDNFFRNRQLGLLFEVRCEKGKLMFCSSDLQLHKEKRPVARQLLYSMVNYMRSKEFNPQQEISFDRIKKYLKDTEKSRGKIGEYTNEIYPTNR